MLRSGVRRNVRAACAEGARVVARRASAAAPKDEGQLASDIVAGVARDEERIAAFAGIPKTAPSSEYAAHVEFGTWNNAGQPYLFPALEDEKSDHIERVVKAVNGAIGEVSQ